VNGLVSPFAAISEAAGALVHRTTDQSIAAAGAVIQWDSEVYDETAWHDNSVNNSRFTVPAGTTLVRIVTNIAGSGTSDTYIVDHMLNGSAFIGRGRSSGGTADPITCNAASAIIAVSTNDYLESFVDPGTSFSALAGNFTWSSIEQIDASLQRALVSKTASQAITGGASTTLTWDNEVYDTNTFHDNVTNNSRLTAPSTKRYRVSANIQGGVVTGQLVLNFLKDGVGERGLPARDYESGNTDNLNAVSAPIAFTAGQYAEVQVFHTTSTSISNAASVWFSMEEVPSSYLCALVYKSGSQSISATTDTVLAFGAEVYDDATIHDNSTNNSRLTVPSGVTQARVSFGVKTGSTINQMNAWCTKNGSSFLGSPRDETNTAGTDSICGLGAWVDVTPGDYFELVFRCTTATTVSTDNETWFCIECR